MTGPYPDKTTRALITLSSVMSTTMVALDGTIAYVALPNMQSSVSASQEQIVWVLTSYLIASAIMTPLTGWLANRFGRKRVMVLSVVGFTLASTACGFATDLYSIVLFRIVQGMSGAALIPLGQATLLDINPPERHGHAMAIYGLASVFGPIIGPTLGGWLTDISSWRWVFWINVPIGILAIVGMSAFMSESRSANPVKFDPIGFGALAIFLGSLQLMLDRGQQLDWFSSPEICIEAGIMVAFAYITAVHMFTAKNPFIRPDLFRDRNFLLASLVSMQVGVLVVAVMALVAPMLEQLMGYPVMLTGMVTAPRGIGSIISMIAVGQIIGKVDSRYLVLTGLLLCAVALYQLAHLTLYTDPRTIAFAGLIQGMGGGLLFVPLSTLVFSTIDPGYRNEGAALYALARGMGASIGISFLQTMTIRNAAAVQSRLVEGVRPDNPIMAMRAPDFDFNAPASIAMMHNDIVRQAMMVAYTDGYWFLFILTLIILPVSLFMRTTKARAKKSDTRAASDLPAALD